MDFDFIAPTKIFFGRKKEENVGDIIASYGCKKVVLVYGSDRIKRTGLYGVVIGSLNKNGIAFGEVSGIRANPNRIKVNEGVALAKEMGAELILAVGGGSVIDTAKSIAAGALYDGDPFDFNLHKLAPTKTLPVGVILTFPSAGSETSTSCVIQDDETGVKSGFNSDLNRPLFAIENPELAFTVPLYQLAAGISDIMMHSLERYFCASPEDCLSDEWALALVKNVMTVGPKVLANPADYDAQSALMLASTLSHNGLTSIGKATRFNVHPLEHVLSGYKTDVTHGAGIALLYPAWAEYVYRYDVPKFARLTEALFGKKGASLEETAIMGIASMKAFFQSLGMPTSLEDVGLGEKDIPSLVALASGNGTRVAGGYPHPMDAKDIDAIYHLALRKEIL